MNEPATGLYFCGRHVRASAPELAADSERLCAAAEMTRERTCDLEDAQKMVRTMNGAGQQHVFGIGQLLLQAQAAVRKGLQPPEAGRPASTDL